jgi:hypothetical protein
MFRFVVGALALLWFSAVMEHADRGKFSSPPVGREPTAMQPALVGIAEQSDSQFAYGVISRVLDRSVDANRFFDSLLLALIAAQAAIFALLVDKLSEYREFVVVGMLAAGVVAGSAVLLTLAVKEAPDPAAFIKVFPNDPNGTRGSYIDRFVRDTDRNELVRAWKTVLFILALALTLAVSVAAVVEKAVQYRGGMG